MGIWGGNRRVVRHTVACVALLVAGISAASAFGASPTPTPDPAPTTTATKPTKTTPAKSTTPSTSTSSHTSSSSPTSSHTSTTTPPRHTTTPTVVAKPKPKPKPKPVAKPKPKPVAKPKPTPKPKPRVVATPSTTRTHVTPSYSRGGANDLAGTLLLTLAILFLLLAATPWRRIFQYHLDPHEVLRWRVAFTVISLSVGFGYVIAAYLNGAA